MVVMVDKDDQLCVLRSSMDLLDDAKHTMPKPFEDLCTDQSRSWGSFMNRQFCLDWSNIRTDCGVFAYGYTMRMQSPLQSAVAKIKHYYSTIGLEQNFVSTSLLYESLYKSNFFSYRTIKKQKPFCRAAIQLWVRAVATLDMILKDIDADIMVRSDDRHDFIAAVNLLEHITLPAYFGISLESPLFDNYNLVDPVIEWKTTHIISS
jgi:hypothetical protein